MSPGTGRPATTLTYIAAPREHGREAVPRRQLSAGMTLVMRSSNNIQAPKLLTAALVGEDATIAYHQITMSSKIGEHGRPSGGQFAGADVRRLLWESDPHDAVADSGCACKPHLGLLCIDNFSPVCLVEKRDALQTTGNPICWSRPAVCAYASSPAQCVFSLTLHSKMCGESVQIMWRREDY